MADITAFESAAAYWSAVEDGATIAVAVGVIGECVVDFTHWIRSRPWRRKIGRLSALVLILGVTGEFVSQHQLSDANGRIVANLNRDTEELRSKNNVLEEQIAPRRLSDEEIAAMGAALEDFASKKVRILSHPNDVDAAILGAQIIEGLKAARMEPLDRRMTYQSLGSIGIGVLVSGTDQKLVAGIIRAVPSRLGATQGEPPSGFPTLTAADPNPVTPDAIIFVGAKPLPAAR